MRVAYFGTYERRYPRNAQVVSCLRRAGVDVVECHEPVWERMEHKWGAGPRALARLGRAEVRLTRRRLAGCDALIVGYPGHADLPAARHVAAGRPVAFNPLVGLYDTLVDDRRRFAPGSAAARALAWLDRQALRAAELVVADTDANAAYFQRIAGLPPERIATCLVGAEERIFRPGWHPSAPFTALFVGKLIPLHGLDVVLEAARLAPEVHFRVVGSGQLHALLAGRPRNVTHVPWVAYEHLPGEYHRAGCTLGVFGTSAKARRVIPNKAFQALACGAPLVTGDTPAARELLVDGESTLLVPPGDAPALAATLRRLAGDAALARRLASGGHAAYRANASEEVLGVRWRRLLELLA